METVLLEMITKGEGINTILLVWVLLKMHGLDKRVAIIEDRENKGKK